MKTLLCILGLFLLSQCSFREVESKRSAKLPKYSYGDLYLESFTIGNSTYYFGTGQQFSVSDGFNLVCDDEGMTHVAFETKQEFEDVSAFLISKGYASIRFWTSGTKLSGAYTWHSTNTPITNDMLWYPGEPNDPNTDTDICVYFIPDLGLLDNICTPKLDILCEK